MKCFKGLKQENSIPKKHKVPKKYEKNNNNKHI